MKIKSIKNLLTILIAVLSLNSIAWFQVSQSPNSNGNQTFSKDVQDKYSQEEFLKTRTRIFELSNQQNLDGLAALQDEIDNSWGKDQPIGEFGINKYAGLMYYLCGSFASRDFKNDKQYDLARSCIEKVLSSRDKMTISQELALVQFVSGFKETKAQKQDVNNRNKKAEYWLHAWNRLEIQVDKSFDPSQKTPVTKSNLTEDEKTKLVKYNRQKLLLKDRETYYPQFEKFITQNFSNNPSNVSELERLINRQLTDEDLKKSIIQLVKQN